MQTALYREHHRALREVVALMPMTAAGAGEDRARPLLVKSTGLLTCHLKLEDDHLYPTMLANVDPDVRQKPSSANGSGSARP